MGFISDVSARRAAGSRSSGGAKAVRVLSYNAGHDGAVVHLRDGDLDFSIEAEKDSNYRHTPIGAGDLLGALTRLDELPDVVAVGGWWPREPAQTGRQRHVGYRGLSGADVTIERRRVLGKSIDFFSSSHERSHLLCGFGMSPFPQGEPCYALVWEGAIGAFYEIDRDVNIKLIGNVMSEPGHRYASVYGLADPTFPKDAPFSRLSDAGKLMALASFSKRSAATAEEEDLMAFLLSADHVRLDLYERLATSPHYNVGVEDPEFRNFAGIFSDRIFDTFRDFAARHLRKRLPLVITGGCGLNCDWNTKWKESGLFSDVFIPPVANDSGSAIGTAIDAQLHFTGNAKVSWDVYSGETFDSRVTVPADHYDVRTMSDDEVAELLHDGFVLGWVSGRYEIGPRALGNRSILATPFDASTASRLNDIKQREQFRPIAPACLEDDAAKWFGCDIASPFMLFTFEATTDALPAVTHVNGTARLQTVAAGSNRRLHDLLTACKARTGFGVLCNTSLNFKGKGFINNFTDLDHYTMEHGLDGFVIDGRVHLRRTSDHYRSKQAPTGR